MYSHRSYFIQNIYPRISGSGNEDWVMTERWKW